MTDLILKQHYKDWLSECYSDEDQEFWDSLSLLELERTINHYYDGGLKEFRKNVFEYLS